MTASPDMLLLYVDDVARSADFYSDLFGVKPVQQSEGFAMLVLKGGLRLGLWLVGAVEPRATATGGGGELAVALPDRGAVDAMLADLRGKGVTIAQEAAEMGFGYTFVALDPDRHRIRAFFPSQR